MTVVSVVLPTRDRAHLLPRAMQSVLAQTHAELELIVVDDGSTDGTDAVVAQLHDPRIRYHRNERTMGAAAARNIGIANARGEYVAFQDDDDVWLAERLERQLAAMKAAGDDTVLSVCGHVCLEPTGQRRVGARRPARLDFSNGAVGDWSLIATPGWLVQRAPLIALGGFDERLRVVHDWELAFRLSRIGRIAHLAEPLFIQDRVLGSGLLRDRQAVARDFELLIEKHAVREGWSTRVLSRHHSAIGRFYCTAGNFTEGRRWARQGARG